MFMRLIVYYLQILGIRALFLALKGRLTKTITLFKIDREDCAHPFYLRIPSSDVPTYEQVFLHQEYNFQAESEPKVIIDAGANVGLASIYFANQYPQAKIIAIEPENSNFMLLKKNVEPYPNVIPLQAALWNKNEEMTLFDPGLGNWAFEIADTTAESVESGAQTVMAMTVDRIMAEYQFDEIDILKIDIEGAEKEVFEDTSLWIEQVKSLMIELHEETKPGTEASFYNGSQGFDQKWIQGENVYLARGNYLRPN